jgi:hypothetical protein
MDAPFWWAMIFSYGNDLRGLERQVAISETGTIYMRGKNDGFAEWREVYATRTELGNLESNFVLFSEAWDEEMNALYDEHCEHRNSVSNPHNVTAEQVGAYTKQYVDNLFASVITEARVLELIQANMPTNGDEVSY